MVWWLVTLRWKVAKAAEDLRSVQRDVEQVARALEDLKMARILFFHCAPCLTC